MKKIGRGKERITSSSKKEEVEGIVVRKGPWTMEEDFILFNYILNHGEGLWNSVAKASGLKRTGKSCRLRWLNYLRPDVRRGNITSEEQILIIQLHSKLGNSWSKIAKHLPGRTDNEIKNFWRTKIQRHMKTTSSVSNNNNNNKNDYCSTKKVEKGSCSKGSVEMEQQQQHSSNDFDNYHWNVEDLWPLHLLNSHHHQQQPLL